MTPKWVLGNLKKVQGPSLSPVLGGFRDSQKGHSVVHRSLNVFYDTPEEFK